jgi:Sulfotransferase domain
LVRFIDLKVQPPSIGGIALRLPDFLCVGPGRTGTTWLHAALQGHVGLPRIKETRFWGQMYDKGLDWYAQTFAGCDPSQPLGEICPYFPEPEARERIANHIPSCKIIVTLRDPVHRSYSQYRRFRSRAIMHYDFETALDKHPRIAESNRYAHHLKGWIDLFGRENVRVFLFDQLRQDPQAFLGGICKFIGIPVIDVASIKLNHRDLNADSRMPRSDFVARRASRILEWMYRRSFYRGVNLIERTRLYDLFFGGGAPYPPLAPDLEDRLRARMTPEIEAVEAMTGLDLSAWKQPRRAHPLRSIGGAIALVHRDVR